MQRYEETQHVTQNNTHLYPPDINCQLQVKAKHYSKQSLMMINVAKKGVESLKPNQAILDHGD
jgi:hypothetical protein